MRRRSGRAAHPFRVDTPTTRHYATVSRRRLSFRSTTRQHRIMPISSMSAAYPHPVKTSRTVRAAGQELLCLLGASVGVLATSIVVDRRALRVSHNGSVHSRVTQIFVDGPVTAVLRLLRTVLFLGSSALLIWLLGLIAVVVVRRSANLRVARLPFGQIVVRVFAASLVVAVAGPLIGAAGPAGAAGVDRVAASYTDSGGGQRWPNLPPPATALSTKSAATTTTPATAAKITRPAGPVLVFALAPPAAIPDDAPSDLGSSGTPVAQHLVRRGECFWSIAETLVLGGTDEATEADIARYWGKLIEANRSKLPDSSNPDLLWADTVLDLPALTPALPSPMPDLVGPAAPPAT